MKNRKWIAAFAAIALVLILTIEFGSKPPLPKTASAPAPSPGPDPAPSRDIAPNPAAVREAQTDEQAAFLQSGLLSNVPITFFGKVVDQQDQPVAGVRVAAKVLAFDPAEVQKQFPMDLFSDVQGLFSVTGQRGQSLELHDFQKDGYLMDPAFNGASFAFSNVDPGYLHTPDAQKPVVFHLWKKGATEPLIKTVKSHRVIADGRLYHVDLLENILSEKGLPKEDIRVQIKRPAKTNPNIPYEWSFAIDAVDGGIIETSDPYLYRAPDSGYLPGYEYVTPSNERMKWRRGLNKKFYLRSRGGKVYASLDLGVENFDTASDACLTLRCLANPAGSPNLEYDPDKKLNPQ